MKKIFIYKHIALITPLRIFFITLLDFFCDWKILKYYAKKCSNPKRSLAFIVVLLKWRAYTLSSFYCSFGWVLNYYAERKRSASNLIRGEPIIKEKTELAENGLFTPPIRRCHDSYSMRPEYTLSHRIVARTKPKPPNPFCSWRKQSPVATPPLL